MTRHDRSPRIAYIAAVAALAVPGCVFNWAWNDVTRGADDATSPVDAPDAVPPDVAVDAGTDAAPSDSSETGANLDADAGAHIDADANADADADATVIVRDASDVPTVLDAQPSADASACGDAACCAPGTWRVNGTCVPMRSCSGDGGADCVVVDIPAPTSPFSITAYGFPDQTGIVVDGFSMDATEVTVARFRQFWNSTDARATYVTYPDGTPVPVGAVVQPTDTAVNASCNYSAAPGAREHHPVNCLTWATAMAFCAWDGGRLPTEAEFEYAVRWRPDPNLPAPPRTYPWGGTTDVSCGRAQYAGVRADGGTTTYVPCPGNDGALTRTVGSFVASGGIYDLAGNVAEWCADRYDTFHSSSADGGCWVGQPQTNPLCTDEESTQRTVYRITRGGSFASAFSALDNADRDFASPDFSTGSTTVSRGPTAIGLRCVRTR